MGKISLKSSRIAKVKKAILSYGIKSRKIITEKVKVQHSNDITSLISNITAKSSNETSISNEITSSSIITKIIPKSTHEIDTNDSEVKSTVNENVENQKNDIFDLTNLNLNLQDIDENK